MLLCTAFNAASNEEQRKELGAFAFDNYLALQSRLELRGIPSNTYLAHLLLLEVVVRHAIDHPDALQKREIIERIEHNLGQVRFWSGATVLRGFSEERGLKSQSKNLEDIVPEAIALQSAVICAKFYKWRDAGISSGITGQPGNSVKKGYDSLEDEREFARMMLDTREN